MHKGLDVYKLAQIRCGLSRPRIITFNFYSSLIEVQVTYKKHFCVLQKKGELLECRYLSGVLKLNVMLKLLYFKMCKELPVNVILMKRCSCCYGNQLLKLLCRVRNYMVPFW